MYPSSRSSVRVGYSLHGRSGLTFERTMTVFCVSLACRRGGRGICWLPGRRASECQRPRSHRCRDVFSPIIPPKNRFATVPAPDHERIVTLGDCLTGLLLGNKLTVDVESGSFSIVGAPPPTSMCRGEPAPVTSRLLSARSTTPSRVRPSSGTKIPTVGVVHDGFVLGLPKIMLFPPEPVWVDPGGDRQAVGKR